MPARRFGQIAAVCSSIVLVSGYLLYRVSGGDSGGVFPGSKSGRVVRDSSLLEQTDLPSTAPAEIGLSLTATQPAVLLPGSKSGIVIEPPQTTRDGTLIIANPAPSPATAPTTAPAIPTTQPGESFKLKL